MQRTLIHERQIGRVLIQTYTMPEEIPPEDVFESQKDIDVIHAGLIAYFAVQVEVHFGPFYGIDYLGGCAYYSPEDFIGPGYWRDMIHEAAKDCRQSILYQQKIVRRKL